MTIGGGGAEEAVCRCQDKQTVTESKPLLPTNLRSSVSGWRCIYTGCRTMYITLHTICTHSISHHLPTMHSVHLIHIATAFLALLALDPAHAQGLGDACTATSNCLGSNAYRTTQCSPSESIEPNTCGGSGAVSLLEPWRRRPSNAPSRTLRKTMPSTELYSQRRLGRRIYRSLCIACVWRSIFDLTYTDPDPTHPQITAKALTAEPNNLWLSARHV
jgi:hypothetical protein